MAFRSSSFLREQSHWKAIASRLRGTSATYATSTSPKMQAYAPTAEHLQGHRPNPGKKLPLKGEFLPVYVALGMITLSLSLGLYTAKQQVLHSPGVRVKKKMRETVPEVVDPDKVVEEADKFLKTSFFRKVAHVQEFENGLGYMHDPIRKDVFATPPRAETLKSVGIDPKQM